MLSSTACRFLDPASLLLADRSHDTAAIAAAIEVALRDNPNASLLEIEMAFRDLTTERLEIVFGMPAMLAALAAAGMTPEENRAALAG